MQLFIIFYFFIKYQKQNKQYMTLPGLDTKPVHDAPGESAKTKLAENGSR